MQNITFEKRKPRQKLCRNGHPLREGNVYYRPNGYPACRQCMLDADKRYREKQKEVGQWATKTS